MFNVSGKTARILAASRAVSGNNSAAKAQPNNAGVKNGTNAQNNNTSVKSGAKTGFGSAGARSAAS